MHILRRVRTPAGVLLPRFSIADVTSETDRLANLINSHPLESLTDLLPTIPLDPPLLESLISRFFSGHSSAAKAVTVFRFFLSRLSGDLPTPSTLDTTLHILSRARLFADSFQLIEEVLDLRPSLLSSRSLAVVFSRHARFRPFTETLQQFECVERAWRSRGREFGADEFTVLIRAFCVQRRMGEARHVFLKFCAGLPPNSKTLNTLLLGFKEAGDLMAFDLFYHETILRGFKPDVYTYNIRIDAYCKKKRFDDALQMLEEMGRKEITPTLETFTTLIHGAGIAGDPDRAYHMFDEMRNRCITPDTGAYNSLVGAFVRVGDLKRGMKVMEEMEEKEIEIDDVGYYTMLCGFKKFGRFESFSNLYRKMVGKEFVPRARTVMLMMMEFCEKGRLDLGLELWEYMLKKGCCPHPHALDVLIIALCGARRSEAACRCLVQLAERGRQPSIIGFSVLEKVLERNNKTNARLEKLRWMMNLPTSPFPQENHLASQVSQV